MYPQLWEVESPALYQLRSIVREDRKIVDSTTTNFGIRSFRFDPDKGFFLNSKNIKLKGVCIHHDGGTVGAAVPIKIWESRFASLKEIGVNAIRTAHNPPAPEFLDLCDRMGFLVMDEAFDEFTPGKIYAWTRVSGGDGEFTVNHVWIKDGKRVWKQPVSVKGKRWTTWSYFNAKPGAWKVEVQDEGGQVLAAATFTVR